MKRQDLASRRRRAVNRVSIAFLLPTCFFLVLFIFRSVIYTFDISTLDWNGVTAEGTFIGLENWKVLLHDTKFWNAVKNNVIMVISCIDRRIVTWCEINKSSVLFTSAYEFCSDRILVPPVIRG